MEIRIKHYGTTLYESECRMQMRRYQLERNDLENMWAGFGLGNMEELNDEEVRIRIQEKIDVEINRPERNSFSKEEKKVDHYFATAMQSEGDGCELLPDTTSEEQRVQEEEYFAACRQIRSLLASKPEWAEIVIAIVLDGQGFSEYARSHGCHESTVREKYHRALKKLKKIYPNPTK